VSRIAHRESDVRDVSDESTTTARRLAARLTARPIKCRQLGPAIAIMHVHKSVCRAGTQPAIYGNTVYLRIKSFLAVPYTKGRCSPGRNGISEKWTIGLARAQ